MMGTCKDCLHVKVCDNLIAHGLPFEDGKYPAEKFCDLYKSSADVVELPLNIGDVVYASRRWEENGALLPYQITCLTITQNKKKEWRKNYRAFRLINGKTIDSYVSFSFDEIGKNVFLTIEEAERCAKMDGERKEATP